MRYIFLKKICLISFMVLLVSAILLISCRKESPPQPLKIGLIVYLQGDSPEYYDYPTLYGCQLALENMEKSGGLVINGRKHPVELLVEEISPSPEQAVIAARKLINRDGIAVLIGPQYSSDAIPTGSIAESARVPMISPSSTHPDTTRNRDYVFRMSFLDDLQGRAMALFSYTDLQVRKAAVIFNEAEPYSRGIASVFQQSFAEIGGEIVVFEAFTTGEDVSAQLRAVKESEAEIMYLPVFQDNLEKLVKQARQMDIRLRLLGSDTWEQDKLAKIEDFDDSYMTNSWNKDLPDKATVDFVKQYMERFGDRPNGDSALTYDAVQLIFKAVNAVQDISPEAIREGLYRNQQYAGVTGTTNFVDSGDPEKSVVIMHIKDGESSFNRMVTPEQLKARR